MDLHMKKVVELLPNIPPRLSRLGPPFPVPEMMLGMWTTLGLTPLLPLSPHRPQNSSLQATEKHQSSPALPYFGSFDLLLPKLKHK